jgi:hypothetical protein
MLANEWWYSRWDLSWLSIYAIGARQLGLPSVQAWADPVYDAYLSGAWFLYWTDENLYWVAKPHIYYDARHQLHCATGPAITSDIEPFWYWHGVLVTEQIVLHPDTLTAEDIASEANAQVRQVMVARLGIERVCQLFKAKTIHQKTLTINAIQHPYEVIEAQVGVVTFRALKMVNPSVGVYHVEPLMGMPNTVDEALHARKPAWMQRIPVSTDGLKWYQQGDVYIVPDGASSLQPYPEILT